MNIFKNAIAHPTTTVAGLLAAVAGYAPVLSRLGLHLGHYGSTDFIALAGAVATTILGAASADGSALNIKA